MLMLFMMCSTRWLVRDVCNGLTVAKAGWEGHGPDFEDMVDYGFTTPMNNCAYTCRQVINHVFIHGPRHL